jgi:hypothetical protein
MEINTENLIDDVAKLAENVAKELGKLLDGSGKPILRDDLYTAKRNVILDKFNNGAAERLAAIDTAVTSLQSQLSEIENFNLTANLDVDTLNRANALMPHIADETEKLDGALLQQQVETAMRKNDTALMYCYWRSMPNRSRTYESKYRQDDQIKTTILHREFNGELKLLYKKLDAQLTGSKERSETCARITSRLTEMAVAKKSIQLRMRQATGQEQKNINKHRDMIRSWL